MRVPPAPASCCRIWPRTRAAAASASVQREHAVRQHDPADQEAPFPGSQEIERRIKSLVRWNAIAMVVAREQGGAWHRRAPLDVCLRRHALRSGLQPFLARGRQDGDRDVVFYQGHAAPGIYSRAFLEGRLTEKQLENFRRELKPGGGLSSYPHPWLMPDFWEYPTVSMGLGPIMAIYQARFIRYLEDRGLKKPSDAKVWAFLGDGETDEPESLGAITLPAREKLDNLIFVVNCNLQRLDGPVRGNGQIVQELEAVFRGAGWNVIKCLWGRDWDPLLAKDRDGLLVKRMGEIVDGQYQKYAVESGAYLREHFWGADPRLLDMVQAPLGRPAQEADARRPRSAEGLQRLQGGGGIQGRAVGGPGSHHQGLRHGRSRRGQEHRPPAEEAQRRRIARGARSLRAAGTGREDWRCAVLPSRREEPRDRVRSGAPQSTGRLASGPLDEESERADASLQRGVRRVLQRH